MTIISEEEDHIHKEISLFDRNLMNSPSPGNKGDQDYRGGGTIVPTYGTLRLHGEVVKAYNLTQCVPLRTSSRE